MKPTEFDDFDLRTRLEHDVDGALAYQLLSDLSAQARHWKSAAAGTASADGAPHSRLLAQTFATAAHVIDIVAPTLRGRSN